MSDPLCARLIVGSRAYGTAVPESDTDYLRVFLPPADVLLGLAPTVRHGGDDSAYYLHEFVKILLGKGAIQLFEVLFMQPEQMDTWFAALRGLRDSFASKRIERAVIGYVRHELDRIERRKRWLVGDIFPEEQKSARHWKPDPEEIVHGWDVKGAMHVTRLLSEMREYELTRKLTFPRPEANVLRDIRAGKWSHAQWLDLVENSRFSWDLPDEPDMEPIAGFLARLYYKQIGDAYERWV